MINIAVVLLAKVNLGVSDFLVHTVKLKPIIKDQIPGKLVTSGIMM